VGLIIFMFILFGGLFILVVIVGTGWPGPPKTRDDDAPGTERRKGGK
jgi:hypothetical protein